MELAARPGLLIRVAQQPAWVLGVVAEVAGFVLQVIALRHGSLVVVQPLLTTSLLFTIALAGRWTESTVRAGEWLAVVAVVAGLALFLIVASPSEESSGLADASDWIVTGLSIGAAVGFLLWVGLRASGRQRVSHGWWAKSRHHGAGRTSAACPAGGPGSLPADRPALSV